MNDKYNDILNQLEDMIDDSEEVVQNVNIDSSTEEQQISEDKIKSSIINLTSTQKESLLKDVNDVIKNIEAILCKLAN